MLIIFAQCLGRTNWNHWKYQSGDDKTNFKWLIRIFLISTHILSCISKSGHPLPFALEDILCRLRKQLFKPVKVGTSPLGKNDEIEVID